MARDIVAEIAEYVETYGMPDKEALAVELGYASWASLERVLYRAGARELVYRFLPQRRSREEVIATANPATQQQYRRSTIAKVRAQGGKPRSTSR